jgi:hypothetical protein
MKLLKTFAAAALLVFGTAAMAQGPEQGPGNRQMKSSSERAKMETETLSKSLELTNDQQVLVLDINLKYAAKDSVRFTQMRQSGGSVDRDAMMKIMQAERAEQVNEVKAILNDDQKSKYDAYLKEREAHRQGGQGGPQGGQ